MGKIIINSLVFIFLVLLIGVSVQAQDLNIYDQQLLNSYSITQTGNETNFDVTLEISSEIIDIDSDGNFFMEGDLEVQGCIKYNCAQIGGCVIIGTCLN